MRHARSRSIAAAALIVLAACGDRSDAEATRPASTSPPRGGVLRLAVPGDFPPPSLLASSSDAAKGALDPHRPTWYDSAELMRCCLLRTLVSYEGRPTDEGGTTLRPDLAASLPEVSSDGLTWTFRIRRGIRYAPPLQDTEITAPDFVRALLRAFRGAREVGVSTLDQLAIEGTAEYVEGRASTVSGFEIPDPHTLRIRLTRPAGDLPAHFALPSTAPIPPSPSDPGAPFGVASGHDGDYGRFLVASGPYMVEGSERLDFRRSPRERAPVSGFVPGRSLTLVRNPSWDPATDELRPAYVDRIEIAIGGDLAEASARLDAGGIDFVFFAGPPPQAPPDQIARYRAGPERGRVHVHSRDFVRAIAINLALPPFDDIHVRKALNLVMDKARLIELAGGPQVGESAGHLVLNSLEDNLLISYDPYRTPGARGDPEAARAEMRLSRYDRDRDGRCDHAACSGVSVATFLAAPGQADAVSADLAEIGIRAEIETLRPEEGLRRWFDPRERIGLLVGLPYGKDMLNAAPFFRSMFDSRWSFVGHSTNGTMVGASRERLARWGYDGVDVPSIDDRIDACLAQVGGTQVQCWASLDQYLMENVVPWVPYVFERYSRTVSPRVVDYSFDQLMAQPALDRVALEPAR